MALGPSPEAGRWFQLSARLARLAPRDAGNVVSRRTTGTGGGLGDWDWRTLSMGAALFAGFKSLAS